MVRIGISVEGQTEREFVNSILAPYLLKDNKIIEPITICTKRTCSGVKYRGGNVTLSRVESEVKKLLPSYNYVTTFYDFYGFNQTVASNAAELEAKMASMFNTHAFIPYIQKYEFETLVFSSPKLIGKEVDNIKAQDDAQKIVDTFNGLLEEINNSPSTAPSERLIDIFTKYGKKYVKTYHGPYIIDEVGIDEIRSKCPRFNNWVEELLSL